jgi:hypothetical protein
MNIYNKLLQLLFCSRFSYFDFISIFILIVSIKYIGWWAVLLLFVLSAVSFCTEKYINKQLYKENT